jgi:hypothetical protein
MSSASTPPGGPGTDHGTQIAEIIHDVAPDAELVLITCDDGYMVEMVHWLLASDVTTGCTASSYCPQELVTRAKIFMFLRQPEDLG